MIKKIIVESANGVCVGCYNLDREYSEREVREVIADKNKLPILSISTDIVGTALVIICQNLYGSMI